MEKKAVEKLDELRYRISELEKTEEALKESEKEFKILFKKNPSPQVYLDENLRILDINSRFEEIFGYDIREIKNEHINDIVVPKDKITEAGNLDERADDGYFYYETARRTKEGKIIPVSISGSPIVLKEKKRFITTYENITDLKKAESILQKAEQRLRSHVINTPLAVIEWNLDFEVSAWNPAAKKIFGYPKEEAIGRHAAGLLVPENARPQVNQVWTDLLAKRGGERSTNENFTKDGKIILCDWYNTPLVDDEENVIGVASLVLDITERKNAEKNIKELNETLGLMNKIMRHDILNYLNIIDSSLDLYCSDKDELFLSKAFDYLKKSRKLIQMMKESEALIVPDGELIKYDVRTIVNNIAKDYPVEFNVNGECTVMADETIFSVIDNIINNAIVHGKTDRIDINIKRGDNTCEIRIADFGKGIADNLKQKVFEERFCYGEAGGTGLGLYIVKLAVKRYGGSVHIEDNKPNGAIFVINLTLKDEG